MNKLISAFFLALIVVSVASSQEKWKKIENDSFSFSLPESFKKTDARGIDSFVEKYDGGSIVIVFDYGMYSNNFQDWSDKTKYEYLKVDGKDARIGVAKEEHRDGFPYSTQVHFVLGKY
ncbi:MAG TPA: hypothetical protein PKA82_17860, partial [Pyrinomonadaceae bacterium]|nr:hypothetical protein [Pyrinomonadaceae bacterium]